MDVLDDVEVLRWFTEIAGFVRIGLAGRHRYPVPTASAIAGCAGQNRAHVPGVIISRLWTLMYTCTESYW